VILLSLHLALNYAAVRSVSMKTLNRQRANLVFSHLLAYDKVLTPKQVCQSERIFERDGVLRWCGGQIIGFARIGVGLIELSGYRARRANAKATDRNSIPYLSRLMDVFLDQQYVLAVNETSMPTIRIALKSGCTSSNQLKAWLHALILAKDMLDKAATSSEGAKKISDTDQDTLEAITSALTRANTLFDEYSERVQSAGWAMDAALETRCGPRITLRR
jgi:Vitamin B6 photo-protection and homoeostasis